MTKPFALLFALLLPGPANAQLGVFKGSADIGVTQPGSTRYDPQTATYRVTGGGADMWGTADAFHFTWLKLTGDAILEADVLFPAPNPIPLEKAVLMVRQSLDPGAAYADIAIHGDGHITLQYRAVSGGKTDDSLLARQGSTHLRIERRGDRFIALTGGDAPSASTVVALHGPVYVGIGFCAHNANGVDTAIFSNVKLTHPTHVR